MSREFKDSCCQRDLYKTLLLNGADTDLTCEYLSKAKFENKNVLSVAIMEDIRNNGMGGENNWARVKLFQNHLRSVNDNVAQRVTLDRILTTNSNSIFLNN